MYLCSPSSSAQIIYFGIVFLCSSFLWINMILGLVLDTSSQKRSLIPGIKQAVSMNETRKHCQSEARTSGQMNKCPNSVDSSCIELYCQTVACDLPLLYILSICTSSLKTIHLTHRVTDAITICSEVHN